MIGRRITAALTAFALSGPSPVAADPNAGAYLAARQAVQSNDFTQAARFFAEGLVDDPANTALMERAMTSFLALGQMQQAVPVARAMHEQGAVNTLAHLALAIDEIKSGDWAGLMAAMDDGRSVGLLIDRLAYGWAHMALGDVDAALVSFDEAAGTDGMAVYGLTHKAYALASVGDFERAEAIFASNKGVMRYSRQSAIAHVQILSQLGRNQDAVRIIDAVFGRQMDPTIRLLRAQLVENEAVAYNAVRTPTQGMADILHVISGLLLDEAPANVTLIYARASVYLWPEHTPAILLTAQVLEDLDQHELANATYLKVDPADPAFHAAQLGRAEVLREAGRKDAAIDVLESLTRDYPDLAEVYATKGDTLRQAGRYEDAKAAYTDALARYSDESTVKWFVYYTRGIANHRLDKWSEAESDFRAALALRPDQPQILNYLGYSLVERGEKLDEALGMIEAAAAASPDNGAIIDSLGWVLFRLGNYDEAVFHLERAASLKPNDPVINDHLGDAFWAVGRKIEARFQWNRALSFNLDEEDAAHIRDKLESGLDLVMIDASSERLHVASDGN